jgi:Fe-S cluster biogenesis protein NfuA
MALFKQFNENNKPAEPGDTTAAGSGADAQAPAASELETKVEAIIDELRPYLQSDGGDIELLKVEDNIVYVRLVGACHGCPSSTMTLKMGVERRICEAIPEIQAVEMV